jgi:hypothetical protein
MTLVPGTVIIGQQYLRLTHLKGMNFCQKMIFGESELFSQRDSMESLLSNGEIRL